MWRAAAAASSRALLRLDAAGPLPRPPVDPSPGRRWFSATATTGGSDDDTPLSRHRKTKSKPTGGFLSILNPNSESGTPSDNQKSNLPSTKTNPLTDLLSTSPEGTLPSPQPEMPPEVELTVPQGTTTSASSLLSTSPEGAPLSPPTKRPMEVEIAMPQGPPLQLTFGHLALFADGACEARQGHTSVLCTAVAKSNDKSSSSFVPLTVDFQQRAAAGSKIPTNFLRREIGASDKEVLAGRLVDRSVRCLFPPGYGMDTQLVCDTLALDRTNEPDVLAINAASAALTMSDIPWRGPVGAVRVGYVDKQLVLNPPRQQMGRSELNLVVTGTDSDTVVMLEAEASDLDRGLFLDGIRLGLGGCQAVANKLRDLGRGVAKRPLPPSAEVPEALARDTRLLCAQRLRDIFCDAGHDKVSRDKAVFGLRDASVAELKQSHTDLDPGLFFDCFSKLTRELVAELALDDGRRVDGRAFNQMRDIDCAHDTHKPLHGSAVFRRGQTKVLCNVTLDSLESALKQEADAAAKNFFVHYTFPPYATNEIGRSTVGRRELGHGALAEKGLRAVIPKDYPFTIRLTSKVVESNGSSSMATVCGGTLSLLDAGVPLTAPAAGVAVGLLTQPDPNGQIRDSAVLLDILGFEDYLGDMDFKLVGTRTGVTALQSDIKLAGLPLEIVERALSTGHDGINQILDTMSSCISAPRADKTNWPVSERLDVPAHKRGKFLGVRGTNLARITAATEVQVLPMEEDGAWTLFAPNADALAEARQMVDALLEEQPVPEFKFGAICTVRVLEIKEKGVIVELHPALEPVFVPLSQMGNTKVSSSDVYGLSAGDSLQVKYYGRDPVTGSIRLSRKAVTVATESAAKTAMNNLNHRS